MKTPTHEASLPHQGAVRQFEQHFGVKYGSKAAVAKADGKGRVTGKAPRTCALQTPTPVTMPTGVLRRVGPALTVDDVRSAERQLGAPFPTEVAQHYLAANGGVPENQWWDDGEYEYDVTHVLPLRTPLPDGRSVESTHALLVGKGMVDPGLVPFAVDGGGNYFCFDADGAVYFVAADVWADELTAAENRAEARTRVAGSFADCVRVPGPRPEDEEDEG